MPTPSFPELTRAFALRQTEDPVDPTLRSPMENGMEETRPRFTRNRRTFQVSIDLLSASDKDALDSFYQDCSAAGAAYGGQPFTLLDPRNLDNPQTLTVRFAALPKYSDAGWIGADDKGNAAGYRWNCQFQVREM
ncbi:MAG TPA: hypothetical protein VGF88_23660 [Acidobacteriaceae bacterium]